MAHKPPGRAQSAGMPSVRTDTHDIAYHVNMARNVQERVSTPSNGHQTARHRTKAARRRVRQARALHRHGKGMHIRARRCNDRSNLGFTRHRVITPGCTRSPEHLPTENQSLHFEHHPHPRRKITIKFCYSGWEYNRLAFQDDPTP